MKNFRPVHRQSVLAISVAAALSIACIDARALTLGRASVQSALGQTMRAEIEFENLNAAEAESLRVSIASADGYRQAGAQYNPNLAGARVVLQRIANRRASLLITTNKVIQEPFVELVLELNWRGGRLIRNYTLLLDPPGLQKPPRPPSVTPYSNPSGLAERRQAADAGAPAPALAPLSPPLAALPPAPPARVAAPPPPPASAKPPPVSRRGPPPAGAPTAPALVDDPYRVRSGDSLSELAQRGPRPAAISLDRLVLAMYRDNPDAFLDGNIHKLRKGVVLSAAKQSTIDAITDSEARRIIKAQSVDFDAYRRQLAESATESPQTNSRSATGKLEAEVQVAEKAKPLTPDVLKLSKPGAASAPSADSALNAAAQRERELADAKLAELSKNVQELARLSGQAASQPAGSAAGADSSSGSEAGVGPVVAMSTESASSMPSEIASAPAEVASSVTLAPAPAAEQAMAPVVQATEAEASQDSLLDDNLPALGLGAALLALLAGFGVFRFMKRRREAAPETSFLESRLKPDSFFGNSTAEHIDTSEVPETGSSSSMMNYSLSQLDAIGDVDPVAEADVYMAYGRDMQAEEILKEAMRTNPERLSIHTKLLEVYAKRRDSKGFEQLALELFALTNGQGDDWAVAQKLGQELDPENSLYGASDPVAAADSQQPPEGDAIGMNAATMPLSVLPGEAAPSKFDLDLDLDLDLGAAESELPVVDVSEPAKPQSAVPPEQGFKPDAGDMLDFSTSGFDSIPTLDSSPPAPAAPAEPKTAKFAKPASREPDNPGAAPEFSLDLDLPEPSALSAGPSMLPPIEDEAAEQERRGVVSDFDPDSVLNEDDPLERKLELADEFQQIGDVDGARDLLQEVIDSADGALKVKAQAMLASLS